MKYINKKLPLIEIGVGINWTNCNAEQMHLNKSGSVYCSKSEFDLLIEDGFIEEEKLQWYVCWDRGGNKVGNKVVYETDEIIPHWDNVVKVQVID